MVGNRLGISNLCAPTWGIFGRLLFFIQKVTKKPVLYFGVSQDQFLPAIGYIDADEKVSMTQIGLLFMSNSSTTCKKGSNGPNLPAQLWESYRDISCQLAKHAFLETPPEGRKTRKAWKHIHEARTNVNSSKVVLNHFPEGNKYEHHGKHVHPNKHLFYLPFRSRSLTERIREMNCVPTVATRITMEINLWLWL